MRVTEKGQVTIPKDIRDRMGIVPGSDVEFISDEKGARLVLVASNALREPVEFKEWLDGVSGSFDFDGMSTDEYMEWLRGPRDDLGPR